MAVTDHDPEPWQVRAAVYFVAALQTFAAAYELTRGTIVTAIVGALMLGSAVALIRRLNWGRRTSVLVMWLLIVIAVGSTLPARIEGDEALGVESPSVTLLVAQLVAVCSMALAALHLLAKYKSRFRSAYW